MRRRRQKWSESRSFYPIDWPQLSKLVRKDGVCRQCGRPHLGQTEQAPDGRWRLVDGDAWKDDRGKKAAAPPAGTILRKVRVVIQAAHRDHRDGSLVTVESLIALCRRHHLAHDREWNRREAAITTRSRYAMGDLLGPTLYPR